MLNKYVLQHTLLFVSIFQYFKSPCNITLKYTAKKQEKHRILTNFSTHVSLSNFLYCVNKSKTMKPTFNRCSTFYDKATLFQNSHFFTLLIDIRDCSLASIAPADAGGTLYGVQERRSPCKRRFGRAKFKQACFALLSPCTIFAINLGQSALNENKKTIY